MPYFLDIIAKCGIGLVVDIFFDQQMDVDYFLVNSEEHTRRHLERQIANLTERLDALWNARLADPAFSPVSDKPKQKEKRTKKKRKKKKKKKLNSRDPGDTQESYAEEDQVLEDLAAAEARLHEHNCTPFETERQLALARLEDPE